MSDEEDRVLDEIAKSYIDDLREEIDGFLKERRRAVSGKTLMCLADAAAELEEDSARIERRHDGR